MFKLPPTILRLLEPIQELARRESSETLTGREMHWISYGVNQLREALDELEESHGHLLAPNPTLIWQRHIMSATDPKFWPLWEVKVKSNLTKNLRPTA